MKLNINTDTGLDDVDLPSDEDLGGGSAFELEDEEAGVDGGVDDPPIFGLPDDDDDLGFMDEDEAESRQTAAFNAAQTPFSVRLVIDSLRTGMASAGESPNTIVGRIAVDASDFGEAADGKDLRNELHAVGGKIAFIDRSRVHGIAPRVEGYRMAVGADGYEWELEIWLTGDLFQNIHLLASHVVEVLHGNEFDPLLDSCLELEAVVQNRMPREEDGGVALAGWVKSLKFGRAVRKF